MLCLLEMDPIIAAFDFAAEPGYNCNMCEQEIASTI